MTTSARQWAQTTRRDHAPRAPCPDVGCDEAQAGVVLGGGAELAVPLVPLARREIVAQGVDRSRDDVGREALPDRGSCTDVRVEVLLR